MAVAKSLRAILEGNPVSADHRVVNAELRAKLEEIELIASLSGVSYFEDALADLPTGTEGQLAMVLDDGTASNNGVYLKGASAWAKTADLPAGLVDAQGVQANLDTLEASLATVATSGSYDDLGDKPTLGTAAAAASTDFATAAQGSKADTAVQPGALGTAAASAATDFATAAQGAKADTAVQPGALGSLAAKSEVTSDELGTESVIQSKVAGNAISNGKLAQMPALRIKGNNANEAANASDLTVAQTKAMLELNNVDNTSDASKPVSTAQAAAIAAGDTAARVQWSGKVFPQTSTNPFVLVREYGDTSTVTFPQLRIERENGGAVVATGPVTFVLPPGINYAYYYIDLDDDNTIKVSETKQDAYSSATVVSLGVGGWGDYSDKCGLPERRVRANGKTPTHKGLATVAYTAFDVPSTYFEAGAQVVDDGFTYTCPVQLQPAWATRKHVRIDAGKTVDLSRVRNGKSMTFAVPSGGSAGKVIIDPATPFLGGFNEVTIPAGGAAMFEAVGGNPANGWAFFPAHGTTITTATVARHIYDETILFAGQSLAVQMFNNGGIGGFVNGLMDSGWMGGAGNRIAPDFNFISGATGSTSIDKRGDGSAGDTLHWWDALANSGDGDNGPVLDACLAAISTATGQGKPAPKFVFWMQGRGDNAAIQAGTYDKDSYKDSLNKVLQAIADVCDPTVQFFIAVQESEDNWANERGASATRQACLELIAENLDYHLAGSMNDLPRGLDEPHMTGRANLILGMRFARTYGNVEDSLDLTEGPTVNTLTTSDGGFTTTITFSSDNGLYMPEGVDGTAEFIGLRPLGLEFYRAGDVAGTDDPTPIAVEIVGNTYVVRAAETMVGGYFLYPGGSFGESRQGNIVTDKTKHADMRGLPLRAFVTEALT